MNTLTKQQLLQQINNINYHANRILLQDKDNQDLAKLGLSMVLYFYEGGSTQGQMKIIQTYDEFYQAYKEHLHGMHFSEERRFVRLKDGSYANRRAKAVQLAEKQKQLAWVLSSENGKLAADYQINALTGYPNYEDMRFLSYMRLRFPLDWLASAAKRQEFADWLQRLAQRFEIFHGYAGLTLAMPHDFSDYVAHEYQIARNYYGVMPDSCAFTKDDWKEGLKTVSWYTLLGQELVQRLGGATKLKQQVALYPELTLTNMGNALVIKTGELPELGDIKQPLPFSYQAVNALVKSVRASKSDNNILDMQIGGGHHSLNAWKTLYWLARWDNPNFIDGVFDPKGDKQQLMPVIRKTNSVDKVPYSGLWTPYNYRGKTIHLNQGQFFPDGIVEEEGAAYGFARSETLWRLIERDDDGPLLVKPEF